MQTPQALRTDPKCWTGLKVFATAALKTDFVQPSSVAGVAANDSQADAFMAEHGAPLLGGKCSQYVRPFVRRKRLRSMLSALMASSGAATAASFWEGKSIKGLSEMVPDMSDALASMPQGMAVLDAAHMFQLDTVTGPLLLSMAACFWHNALAGKFGAVARHFAQHEDELGLAYEAYFNEHGINASVSVLVGARHVPDGSSVSGAPSEAFGPAPSRASGPAPSRASGPAPSRASSAGSQAKAQAQAKARAQANESKEKRSKEKVPKSKGMARKGKASAMRQRAAKGTTLLNNQ